METTDKENIVPPENGSDNSETSADKTWDSEKYPAYQKSFPKKYWGHKAFEGINSMDEMLDRFVNPRKKAPETYEGIDESVTEAMRAADLSQEDARKIAEAYSKLMPKRYTEESLKEVYGADWEQADKDYNRAVERIITDENDRKAFNAMRNNPLLFSFVRVVGRNIGDGPNLDTGKDIPHVEKKGNTIAGILMKHMN